MDFVSVLLYLLSADDPLGIAAAFLGAFFGAFIIRLSIKKKWPRFLYKSGKPKSSKTG